MTTSTGEDDQKISKVQVSFLEIYKEEIFDLLSSVVKKIEIKNDKGRMGAGHSGQGIFYVVFFY